jgi:hypothetical protein
MASVLVAVGVAIYYTVEKVHDRKEKKRALAAEEASKYGSVVEFSTTEGTAAHYGTDSLPAYHKEKLPAYAMMDQHPALKTKKQSVGLPYW